MASKFEFNTWGVPLYLDAELVSCFSGIKMVVNTSKFIIVGEKVFIVDNLPCEKCVKRFKCFTENDACSGVEVALNESS